MFLTSVFLNTENPNFPALQLSLDWDRIY